VWKIISVKCMSVVPTDLNFCCENCCYLSICTAEVILWPLYFRGGNDVTPHCRYRGNSVVFSALNFPKPNVIVKTAVGYI